MGKYEKLLNMLMNFNSCLRFAAVCIRDEILWHSQRLGINIILLADTKKDLQIANNAWQEREKITDKVGNGMCVIAAYEKIKRITSHFTRENFSS